jgi:hypothetical protein
MKVEEMKELWDNDPSKCKLCNTETPHLHYINIDGNIRQVAVINDSYKIDEQLGTWLTMDEIEEHNIRLREVFIKHHTQELI